MIALNVQEKEGIEQSGRQGPLDVADIFPTIQGEGPFTGERAVFVRLAGCNFQCPECDTDYTTGRHLMSYIEIWNGIRKAYEEFGSVNNDLFIVLTGGEPLRQNIGPFITFLLNERIGMHIQIETNGLLYRDDVPWFALGLSTVCSPKGGTVPENLIPHISAYKYVLEDGKIDPADGLPTEHLGNPNKIARPPQGFKNPVYVQPADLNDLDKNRMNLAACIYSCRKFGYRLGLQQHKIIGLP